MPSIFLKNLLAGTFLLVSISLAAQQSNGLWKSKATGGQINFTINDSPSPIKDFNGKYATIVYLENLGFKKVGRNSNEEDVDWLLSQGYRVIELDYENHEDAVSPKINKDIIAINDAIAEGTFCGVKNYSLTQSFVLFEGYRIAWNVPYFKDDPTVYNTPEHYTEGDSLRMDIIYPANAMVKVPVILSFSYSNSYATYDEDKGKLTDANKNKRTFLPYTFAGFDDSFLEGAPARGMAWAIADHPKYCPWGSGKPKDGRNDTYKSYMTNPDGAQKVKSAIRTLRAKGVELGLSGKIGIYGFSRGSTAGSMAIGDRSVFAFEKAGFHLGVSDEVQAAALGPGVFDYTLIYKVKDDGDGNLESRCPWAWGPLEDNFEKWQSMGAAYLAETENTAPVLFFYNSDDEPYYQEQIIHFKEKLDKLSVPTSILKNYGTGHSVPKTETSLNKLYTFFLNLQVIEPQENGKSFRRKN
ncbi:hypothetical protein QWY93_08645 [Echinicola jeungdonensis]|uniref:Alpha/beta hydrolase family protein n=1 Tax=Echinicola jeungdonensis TaxID=709343 RepID=A0ABV5JAL0_9BACT|nr:hypothetical protein [Echinicola jeungdonensis]MDN3669396.1 hypothetical protein [Echinicola jeungdonensis]